MLFHLKVKLCFFLIPFLVISCSQSAKNESNLTASEIQFIQDLGLLNKNEQIEVFESNGGFEGIKQSGNFITNERMASYWIEDQDSSIYSAYFKEIDSLKLTDLVSKMTYSSFITVYKSDGSEFKVYVDADSTRTYEFYHKANENFKKNQQSR